MPLKYPKQEVKAKAEAKPKKEKAEKSNLNTQDELI